MIQYGEGLVIILGPEPGLRNVYQSYENLRIGAGWGGPLIGWDWSRDQVCWCVPHTANLFSNHDLITSWVALWFPYSSGNILLLLFRIDVYQNSILLSRSCSNSKRGSTCEWYFIVLYRKSKLFMNNLESRRRRGFCNNIEFCTFLQSHSTSIFTVSIMKDGGRDFYGIKKPCQVKCEHVLLLYHTVWSTVQK